MNSEFGEFQIGMWVNLTEKAWELARENPWADCVAAKWPQQITGHHDNKMDVTLNSAGPIGIRHLVLEENQKRSPFIQPLTLEQKVDILTDKFDELLTKLDKVIDWDVLEYDN